MGFAGGRGVSRITRSIWAVLHDLRKGCNFRKCTLFAEKRVHSFRKAPFFDLLSRFAGGPSGRDGALIRCTHRTMGTRAS